MIKIIKKEEFSKEVLEVMKQKNLSGIDAVLFLVDKYNMEFENVSKLIDKSLKEMIEFEATEMKMLKSESLPV